MHDKVSVVSAAVTAKKNITKYPSRPIFISKGYCK